MQRCCGWILHCLFAYNCNIPSIRYTAHWRPQKEQQLSEQNGREECDQDQKQSLHVLERDELANPASGSPITAQSLPKQLRTKSTGDAGVSHWIVSTGSSEHSGAYTVVQCIYLYNTLLGLIQSSLTIWRRDAVRTYHLGMRPFPTSCHFMAHWLACALECYPVARTTQIWPQQHLQKGVHRNRSDLATMKRIC